MTDVNRETPRLHGRNVSRHDRARRITNAEIVGSTKKGAVFQSEINFTARAEFYAVDFEAQLDAFIRKYRL